MITKLLKFIRQAREKAQHNESKDRGPVPPVRTITKPMPRKAAIRPVAKAPDQADKKPSKTSVPKVAQRGAGKNVMVFAGVDEDADAALERLDRNSSSLKLEDTKDSENAPGKGGFDPYNSGVFDTKKVWNNSKRS